MEGVPACGRRASATRDQLAAFEPPAPDDEEDVEEEDDDGESFDDDDEEVVDGSLVPEPLDDALELDSAVVALFRLSVR